MRKWTTTAADARNARPVPLDTLAFLVLAASLVPMVTYYAQQFRIVAWPIDVSGLPAFRDFINLWAAGRAAASGAYAQLFDSQKYAIELQRLIDPSIGENWLVWSYPPTGFWLGLPFAGLPFYPAAAAWLLLGLTGVFWAYRIDATRSWAHWTLPFIVLAPGTLLTLYFGQTGLLTTTIFIGGMLLAPTRPLLSGALLAVFVVKPHMGLALPVVLIALGHWRAVAATALFATLYLLATLLAFGTEPWLLYFAVTLPRHLAMLDTWGLANPWMFNAQYFLFLGTGMSPTLAIRLHWLCAATALVALAWTLPRLKDRNLQLLIAAAATLVISPYMQSYELVLPAIAALRALAYMPPEASDPYFMLRRILVLLGLTAPAVGLVVMTYRGPNLIPLMMFAMVVCSAARVNAVGARTRAVA